MQFILCILRTEGDKKFELIFFKATPTNVKIELCYISISLNIKFCLEF